VNVREPAATRISATRELVEVVNVTTPPNVAEPVVTKILAINVAVAFAPPTVVVPATVALPALIFHAVTTAAVG